MKTKTLVFLALLISSIAFAVVDQPDSMFIHFTAANGADSIVIHTLSDIDSIVYYAPPDIDWDNAAEGVTQANALSDVSGNTYSAVKINDQVWMAENLNTPVTTVDTVGGSADNICQDHEVFAWDNTDNNLYGKLYSREAAIKACPTGWHLPSDEEWTAMTDYLERNSAIKGYGSKELKATWGWCNESIDGWSTYEDEGIDSYGFAALPAGLCGVDGARSGQGCYTYFWTSSINDDTNSFYSRELTHFFDNIFRSHSGGIKGYSVRCIKD